MGYDAVALHLAKAQAAVSRTALHGLPGQQGHRTPPAAVDLVIHHVLEALVVGGVQEYLGLQGGTDLTVREASFKSATGT